MNSFSIIIDTYLSPGKAFRAIKEKPVFLVALLLSLIFSTVAAVIVTRNLDFSTQRSEIREAMEKRTGKEMSDEDLDRIITMQNKWSKIVAPIAAFMGGVIVTLILALIFFLLFKLLDTETTYKQSLSTTVHSFLPHIIGSILASVVIFVKGPISPMDARGLIKSNLGFLVSPTEQKVLHSLLSSIDIFSIWTLALLVIGFSIVSDKKPGKVAPWIIGLWVLYVGIKLVLAAVLPG